MDKIEREIAFTDDWYSKNKGMPTYADAIAWADETMIEKACEYLITHFWQNVDDDNDPIIESVHNITLDNFIKDFKRYLEKSDTL